MATADFTTTILVNQSPQKAYESINNVRGWWSEEIEGGTSEPGDVFKYHFEDVHRCEMKLIEVIPAKRIVWLVLDNYFKFTKDQSEWKGTKIIFELTEKEGNTEIRFTHQGLVPAHECYEICHSAWTNYIQNSLHGLITNGKGKPNGKEKPQTKNEKQLLRENAVEVKNK
ncbi:MAG: SRPBCC domain-containing protein [Bacteroidota bacterium]